MKYFDSSLGIELPERSYADACVLTKENVMVIYINMLFFDL